MSSKRSRRHFSSEQKAALLKRHHLEKVAVSTVCEENKLQPSVFYDWQRLLFANAAEALEASKKGKAAPTREKELAERNAQLEAKLARKDAVIAEISEEYVKLKKELGEP